MTSILRGMLVMSFILGIGATYGQSNLLILNEDFEGANNFSLNVPGVGTPGGDNQWIINDEYIGSGGNPTTTDQTNTFSGTISFPNGKYMHVYDVNTTSPNQNASYNPNSSSDRFAVTPSMCTVGFTNVRFTFFFVCEGASNANVELYYSADGGPWISTGNTYSNQTQWKYEVVTDPAFENVNSLRFGFRWVNSGSAPNNIAFGVDDIFVLGDYLPGSVSLNITTVPTQVCQGSNMIFSYSLSDSLCTGQYSIQLIAPGGGLQATWSATIAYPQTSGSFFINIPFSTPVGNCYTLRLNRISPAPAITGVQSVCFDVVACPNTITTLQPVVTFGAEAPNGVGVCVGSVIDVPFWSTGTFNSGNTYTAQLSDANGNFTSPSIIGTFNSNNTYDPLVVPSPGTVSGKIPSTPPGCGYYIRVVSSNPGVLGSIWGPFCIKDCDIETNNGQDISVCISTTEGDTSTIPYTINIPPINATYFPGNEFRIEVLSSMTFQQINMGALGSVQSTTSGTMQLTIPPLPVLSQAPYFMGPGMYYIRVTSTNSSLPDNQLGQLIRLTIGAPQDFPIIIGKTADELCFGQVATLFVANQFNPQSTYQWFLNGSPFPGPNTPAHPISVLFNGAPGDYVFRVQETNFGCVGELSPPDTVTMLTIPSGNIAGPDKVCFGDTNAYSVSFVPNTAYGWSLDPANAGTILDNGADHITIAWDQIPSGTVTLNLDYATNICGSSNGTFQIEIFQSPEADAGLPKNMCVGDSVQIGGNPTATGGKTPYSYQWSPAVGLQSNTANTPNPIVISEDTITFTITIEDDNGCKDSDKVLVLVHPNPQPDAGGEFIYTCEANSARLGGDPTAPPGTNFLWKPAGLLDDPTIANPETTPPDSTMFHLQVTDAVTGCKGEDSTMVLVDSLVVDTIDAGLCKGTIVTLIPPDTSSQLVYNWSTGAKTPTFDAWIPGYYSLAVDDTSNNGCGDFFDFNVVQHEPYVLPFGPDTICHDEQVILDVPGEGLTIWPDSTVSQTYTVNQTGTYTATFVDTNGCFSTADFLMEVERCFQTLFVPNAFTPNGDGINDLFFPKLDGRTEVSEFRILNRWGSVIYETSGPEPWDGTAQGKPVPIGVYVWQISYRLNNQTYTDVGQITVVDSQY